MSEETLWNAVIVQAINDLFHGSDKERRDSFRWIFENNSNFRNVCDYAKIDLICLRQTVFSRGA
ncbi:MAG: hypothetical protein IJ730_06270 [Alphaproteobacteria bacterium]|nr:hypothetical protein [Alphaproteobacteria bacterium]